MLMIVSPAKRMVRQEGEPPADAAPRFLDDAHELARALRALGPEGAREVWRCSERLAAACWEQLRTLPEDLLAPAASLSPAVMSYVGIQYQHLSPQVMEARELEWLARHLRIVSGLYGLLRPFDGICPHRLEMRSRLAVAGAGDLYGFWGSRIADALAEGPEADVVVNLASQEYARAVLPWLRPGDPRQLTCSFLVPRGRDGKLVQQATEAKAARGSLVRWAAERGVEDVDDLRGFRERGYRLDEALCDEGTLAFVRR